MDIRQKLRNEIWPALGATRLCERQKCPLYIAVDINNFKFFFGGKLF